MSKRDFYYPDLYILYGWVRDGPDINTRYPDPGFQTGYNPSERSNLSFFINRLRQRHNPDPKLFFSHHDWTSHAGKVFFLSPILWRNYLKKSQEKTNEFLKFCVLLQGVALFYLDSIKKLWFSLSSIWQSKIILFIKSDLMLYVSSFDPLENQICISFSRKKNRIRTIQLIKIQKWLQPLKFVFSFFQYIHDTQTCT